MNPEIKRVWVRALRSGRYKRAEGALRIDFQGEPHFCCLGVLCDLGEKKDWRERGDGTASYGSASSYLPKVVERLAAVPPKVQRRLATMNDEGATFAEIADYIEENL